MLVSSQTFKKVLDYSFFINGLNGFVESRNSISENQEESFHANNSTHTAANSFYEMLPKFNEAFE